MKISYDKEVDALYFQIGEGQVERTIEASERVIVDLDKKGNIFGIEILFASKSLPNFNLSNFELELPNGEKIHLNFNPAK